MSILNVIKNIKPKDRVIVYLNGNEKPISGKFLSSTEDFIDIRIPVIPHPSNTEYWDITVTIGEISAIGIIAK